MTTRQRDIAIFISEYWEENWTSPTCQEIAEAVGLASKASAWAQLQRMVGSGYLERKALRNGTRVLYRLTPASASLFSDRSQASLPSG